MRLLTSLRSSGSHWSLPALFAVTALMGAHVTWRIGYPTADLASVSLSLFLAGPLTAILAAHRFSGFARFVGTLRPVRSGSVVVFAAARGLLLGAAVTFVIAVLVTARAMPTQPGSAGLVVLDFVTVLACGFVGVAAGLTLPVVLAVPVSAVATFLWFSLTASSGSALLHNVNASFAACCASSTQPATRAVLAGGMVAVVVCAGVLLLLVSPRWTEFSRPALALALPAVLLLGFGAGAAVAASGPGPLTVQAVQPRTTDLVCSDDDGHEVCLWPENRDLAGQVARLVGDLDRAVVPLGLATVPAVRQGSPAPDAVAVEARADLPVDTVRYSLAAG